MISHSSYHTWHKCRAVFVRPVQNFLRFVSGLSDGEAVVLNPADIRTGQPLIIEASAETSPASRVKPEWEGKPMDWR